MLSTNWGTFTTAAVSIAWPLRPRPPPSALRPLCWYLGEVHHRPHLDRAEPRRRNARRDLDRLVQVLGLDEVVAAQLLLRLGERAIGGRRLPVPHPHRHRGLRRVERIAADVLACLLDVVGEREVLTHDRVRLVLRPRRPVALVLVDQAQVFHGTPPRVKGFSPISRSARREIDTTDRGWRIADQPSGRF